MPMKKEIALKETIDNFQDLLDRFNVFESVEN